MCTQVLSSSFACRCLQLENTSPLRLSVAVAGENMMWNFSFMHSRHMPDEGLKELALVKILQLVV